MKNRWPAFVSVLAAIVVGWLCFQKAQNSREGASDSGVAGPKASDSSIAIEGTRSAPAAKPQVLTNHKSDRSVEKTQPPRVTGPSRTGLVVLEERIAIVGAPLLGENPSESVFHEARFLDHTFPIVFNEFYDVPGSPGSGVFFGKVEGHPHSSVKWAYHGNAESVEIRVHGEDTVKVEYAGNGREHRVFEWSSDALGRCSICLREE